MISKSSKFLKLTLKSPNFSIENLLFEDEITKHIIKKICENSIRIIPKEAILQNIC